MTRPARSPMVTRSNATFPRRRAFTLIELLVVIALSAVMATIAAVSLAGAHRAARAQDVVEQIATFDRLAREHARRFGRSNTLTFDLSAGTITRTTEADGPEAPADSRATLRLPSGIRIARILTPDADTTAGELSLPASTDGHRATYAIQLIDAASRSRWQLTLGLTGQSIELADDREAQDIFRALRGDAGATASAAPASDDAR